MTFLKVAHPRPSVNGGLWLAAALARELASAPERELVAMIAGGPLLDRLGCSTRRRLAVAELSRRQRLKAVAR